MATTRLERYGIFRDDKGPIWVCAIRNLEDGKKKIRDLAEAEQLEHFLWDFALVRIIASEKPGLRLG